MMMIPCGLKRVAIFNVMSKFEYQNRTLWFSFFECWGLVTHSARNEKCKEVSIHVSVHV